MSKLGHQRLTVTWFNPVYCLIFCFSSDIQWKIVILGYYIQWCTGMIWSYFLTSRFQRIFHKQNFDEITVLCCLALDSQHKLNLLNLSQTSTWKSILPLYHLVILHKPAVRALSHYSSWLRFIKFHFLTAHVISECHYIDFHNNVNYKNYQNWQNCCFFLLLFEGEVQVK